MTVQRKKAGLLLDEVGEQAKKSKNPKVVAEFSSKEFVEKNFSELLKEQAVLYAKGIC